MTEIEQMEAGPELDRLIAEEVMGRTLFIDESDKCLGACIIIDKRCVPFRPSTDIAAAWQVVDFLRGKYPDDLPGTIKVVTYPAEQDGLCATVTITELSLRVVPGQRDVYGKTGRPLMQYQIAHATTAPLAICRAALAAVRASTPRERRAIVKVSELVAAIEDMANEIERLRDELAELRRNAVRPAPPPPKKTPGEVAAEKMVEEGASDYIRFRAIPTLPTGEYIAVVHQFGSDKAAGISKIRRIIAAAIDAARAAERERCAKAVEQPFLDGGHMTATEAAEIIRALD